MATLRASARTRPLAGQPVVEEAKGFLGRWARRKTDVLQGKPLEEPQIDVKPVPARAATLPVPGLAESSPATLPPIAESEQPEPALSLEDVKLLTKDSDFKPFMSQSVGPEVRNAAMKKLFADPHFNVMDGLDTYIDDYSKSDPIPESMLRQMTSAKFLKLFDDEEDEVEKADAASSLRENANKPTDQSVAQSYEPQNIAASSPVPPEQSSQPELLTYSGASQENHAHTDLRLQPDHAAPAPDAGRGTQ